MANFHSSKSDYDHRRHRNHHNYCCKRHPTHHQSPGVCSLCLTEKLSRILSPAAAAASSRNKISDSISSSSSSSYYSSPSSSSSSCSSPNLYNYKSDNHRRKTAFVFSASSIFKKSKSMARLKRGTESDCGKKSNSDLGFWSRFLNRPRRKRMEFQEVLMRSRTVVQRNVHG